MLSLFALFCVVLCVGQRLAVLAADIGPSVVGSSRIDDVQEQEEVSQKEVCFMELYKAEDVSSLSYTKETLVKDEFSRSVYLTDGYKKDESGAEYYYKSFCYKAFHYSSHKEKTFGDSNAASIVDGGIGRAFRNTNVESDGIDANDGTLKKFTEDEQANKGGLGKNY
ncbi:hypothetical protein DMC30DRAFT_418071 [Rhodotorula diobovata]|uniref:Uncharacterized protein n=1 Tax=Rhodotorula diobovata TaxID=5288 RepID=A0A5C5FR13_9BASI|nr:hypothetical protein DMC30DRAFT_418071 [Rhodotorula diobovata]